MDASTNLTLGRGRALKWTYSPRHMGIYGNEIADRLTSTTQIVGALIDGEHPSVAWDENID
uniref:Uncharacterized protein n=1 Tax=Arion vulgaris TaxID=1028688 RepID=A0A0B6ZRU8_9EUPU